MKFTPGALIDGRKIVTVAGTREALMTVTDETVHVTVVAETDNTGTIVVGDTTVVAALATRRGVPLNAGDAYTINITQGHFIWIDSTVSGDGVTFTAETVS